MSKKKKMPVYGPASETQRQFLNHDAQFVIYGGGRVLPCASTLKTFL